MNKETQQISGMSKDQLFNACLALSALALAGYLSSLGEKRGWLRMEDAEKCLALENLLQIPKLRESVLEQVPFYSQYAPEMSRQIRQWGCGPVCLAMELAYRQRIVPDISQATGVVCRAKALGYWSPNRCFPENLADLSRTYGIKTEHFRMQNLGQLYSYLQESGDPALVLFKVNADLADVNHYLLVLKIDPQQRLVVAHDPAALPLEKGENRVFDIDDFNLVWSYLGRETVCFGASQAPVDKDGFPSYFLPGVKKWKREIIRWSVEYQLEPRVIASLMQIESAGEQYARSRAGAVGLFQPMPDKFQAGDDYFDPDANAGAGLTYYNYCLRRAQELGYRGVEAFVEAAKGYNSGASTIGKPPLWSETEDFIAFFRALYTGLHPGIDNFYWRRFPV